MTFFLLIGYWPAAHASINYYSDRKVWVLQAGHATYAMGVNERGELQAIYWGSQVPREADFSPAHSRPEVASFDNSTSTTPQEYPGWGAGLYDEPALKATYSDGNREVVLHYVEQHKDATTSRSLKDVASPSWCISITGCLRRQASSSVVAIENHTDQAITLESAQSAAWSLPHGEGYGRHYLTGRWGWEWQLHLSLCRRERM